MRALPIAAASALALTFARSASAFCGFYVAGADAKLFADASQVVLMREGTRTVLSMQNDYKGPPEKFALVIPVPVVLQKEQVKTLPREVFDKIDKLGAPRLVEYWERDPCAPNTLSERGGGLGGLGGGTKGSGVGAGPGGDLGVTIEAKFAVGEYEIVILSAKDSGGLETWLAQEKYTIPSGSEPYFRPYVASGSKFFVARVDPKKVKFEDGRATLSPLRFHYDANEFTLPVRLGLVNSSGVQDLIVNILARRQRYDVANYPAVTIPTNLDVAESARGRFAEFYAALFDATIAKNPKAVVTEYAWDAGTCDPCPGPTLDNQDVATLGADALVPVNGVGGATVMRSDAQIDAAKVTGGTVADVDRVLAGLRPRFRRCHDSALQDNPKLTGNVTIKIAIGKTGEVESTTDSGSTLPDKGVISCMHSVIRRAQFSAPEGGPATATVSVTLVAQPGRMSFAAPGGVGSFVLTRLHARYGKDSLGEDLVFKAVPAIAGGRELSSGADGLERGARAAPVNNFQGRYAIRHPWTGPVACKEPIRNRWGGPPPGEGRAGESQRPLAAQKTAFAPRGQTALDTFFAQGVKADIGLATPPGEAASASTSASPPASTSSADAGSADGGSAPPSSGRGCAGCSAAARTDRSAPLAVLGFVLAALGRVLIRRTASATRRCPADPCRARERTCGRR